MQRTVSVFTPTLGHEAAKLTRRHTRPQPPDLDEEAPPTGLTRLVLVDRLFKQACKDEGITLEELRAADHLEGQVRKIQKQHAGGIFSDGEFTAKITEVLGAGPEAIDSMLARYRKRHEGLVRTVLQAMEALKAELEEQLPVPPEVDADVFFSEDFAKACKVLSVTLEDVCKFERTKTQYARLKRLRNDERIMDDEYDAKVRQLFGVPELAAEATLSALHKTQRELIEKLLDTMQEIRHAEWEAQQAAEQAQQKHDDYVAALRQQVEQKIAKERAKAENALARQRVALERVLIQRGVQETVRKVEKADRYLATPYLRKKAPLDVALIPKTTAGIERKKLWLIDRSSKAQAKTRHSHTVASAGGNDNAEIEQALGEASSAPAAQHHRPMSAIEKREMLLQEREEEMKRKESAKLHRSEMVRKQKEAEIRKKQHQAKLKQIHKENAVVRPVALQQKSEFMLAYGMILRANAHYNTLNAARKYTVTRGITSFREATAEEDAVGTVAAGRSRDEQTKSSFGSTGCVQRSSAAAALSNSCPPKTGTCSFWQHHVIFSASPDK